MRNKARVEFIITDDCVGTWDSTVTDIRCQKGNVDLMATTVMEANRGLERNTKFQVTASFLKNAKVKRFLQAKAGEVLTTDARKYANV